MILFIIIPLALIYVYSLAAICFLCHIYRFISQTLQRSSPLRAETENRIPQPLRSRLIQSKRRTYRGVLVKQQIKHLQLRADTI